MIPRGLHVHMAGGLAQPCPVDGCSWTAAGLDSPDGESTSAALRRVEQERDALITFLRGTQEIAKDRNQGQEPDALHLAYEREIARLRAEVAQAYALVEQIPGRQPIDVLREHIAAGEDARIELERWRKAGRDAIAQSGWIVARDGDRGCERCEEEIRRGEAYELVPGTGGLLQHVRCPDPGELEQLRAQVQRGVDYAGNLGELSCPDPAAHTNEGDTDV